MTQETQVICQVLQGDIECFRVIVERYERPIARMIRNIINNRESIPLATVKGRADYLYWPAKDWSRFGRISN